jgi:thiol-disulfide isomerase/thioredoxin
VFKAKRRTVVTVTAVAAVLLAGALATTLLTQGKGNASDSNASDSFVTYQAGQRPLAPDITAKSLTGATTSLSNYRGKTLVLNFWGSWCAPCRAEAPTLAYLSKEYGSKGVAFLGDDVEDTPQNGLAFESTYGITYQSFNDPGYSVAQEFYKVAPVNDTPTTIVIDKTGHVVGQVLGEVSFGEMTTLLKDAAVTQ